MKKLFFTLLILLFALPAYSTLRVAKSYAQQCSEPVEVARLIGPVVGGSTPVAGCTSPTGTKMWEGFEVTDGTSECAVGDAYESVCRYLRGWTVVSGTPEFDYASPGTPPANTACSNSLKYSVETGTAYSYWDLGVVWADKDTNADIFAWIYIESATFADDTAITILNGSSSTVPSWYKTMLQVSYDSPNYYFQTKGGGAISLIGGAITIPGWYKVQLHQDGTEADCYVSVWHADGELHGSVAPAACYDRALRYIAFGIVTNVGNSALSIVLGALWGN